MPSTSLIGRPVSCGLRGACSAQGPSRAGWVGRCALRAAASAPMMRGARPPRKLPEGREGGEEGSPPPLRRWPARPGVGHGPPAFPGSPSAGISLDATRRRPALVWGRLPRSTAPPGPPVPASAPARPRPVAPPPPDRPRCHAASARPVPCPLPRSASPPWLARSGVGPGPPAFLGSRSAGSASMPRGVGPPWSGVVSRVPPRRAGPPVPASAAARPRPVAPPPPDRPRCHAASARPAAPPPAFGRGALACPFRAGRRSARRARPRPGRPPGLHAGRAAAFSGPPPCGPHV